MTSSTYITLFRIQIESEWSRRVLVTYQTQLYVS